jgi:hypothetical protein
MPFLGGGKIYTCQISMGKKDVKEGGNKNGKKKRVGKKGTRSSQAGVKPTS